MHQPAQEDTATSTMTSTATSTMTTHPGVIHSLPPLHPLARVAYENAPASVRKSCDWFIANDVLLPLLWMDPIPETENHPAIPGRLMPFPRPDTHEKPLSS